jgi:hypothetical protein
MWDGIGPSGVGLPSESMMVVRVIGRGDGAEDGDKDDIREDKVFLDSSSAGRADSISEGRSLGVSEDSEACSAFALDHQSELQ